MADKSQKSRITSSCRTSVVTEDERSQIEDEDGDEEVRYGVYRFATFITTTGAPREAGGFARLEQEWAPLKGCAGRNISSDEETGSRDRSQGSKIARNDLNRRDDYFTGEHRGGTPRL